MFRETELPHGSAATAGGAGIAPASAGTEGDALRREYTIETPENVTFGFEVAGIGSRFIGALIDTGLLAGLLIALNLALVFLLDQAAGNRPPGSASDAPEWIAGFVWALYILFEFAIFWGYYAFFELLWNGQSPGKRVAGTRVVRTDGNPAGFIEVAVRNLVRIVDLFPSFYAVGLVTMFLNDSARRLGDFAAGTLVVRDHAPIRLDSLGAPAAPAERPPARIQGQDDLLMPEADLRRLTHADVTLVRDALARELAGRLSQITLHRLAALMALKVGAPPPAEARVETRRFLIDLVDAWERRGRTNVHLL